MSKTQCRGPLLSIVMPTRNRHRYATSAVRSILLSIPCSELELIVQDSSDSRVLEEHLGSSMQDARLRYSYTPPPLSGVDNFNIAAHRATGEYVCFIGDDDGVNPEIMAATQWAMENGFDALTPTLPALYYWPDFETKYRGRTHAGRLYIGSFSGRQLQPNPEAEVRRCIRVACQTFAGMPKVYHGIVRRQVLDEVRRRTGEYFGGASPDMYAAVCTAAVARRVCLLDYPLILPGSSAASTAGSSARRRHHGQLDTVPYLRRGVLDNWPAVIPRFYSVETVWAQAAIEALRAIGRADLIPDFNVPLLHAKCAIAHPDYLFTIISCYCRSLPRARRKKALAAVRLAFALVSATSEWARHAYCRLMNPAPLPGATTIGGLLNIEDATRALADQLHRTGRKFDPGMT